MCITLEIDKLDLKNKIIFSKKSNPKPLKTLCIKIAYKTDSKKVNKKHQYLLKNLGGKNKPKAININELHSVNFNVLITELIS